jgi:microcystin-dependent protein
MAGKQVQRRRGSTSQTAVFTGALGEVTVDTSKMVEVVHDGVTPGGFPQASARDIVQSTADTDAKLALKVPQDSPTGAAKVPKGTTAQRPAAPQPGDFRFNTTTGKFEGYINATLLWQPVGADSIPLFSVFWIAKRAACPPGFVVADGQLLSRATYPEAWAGIQAGNVPVANDPDWLAQTVWRGAYTGGDGATTFRLPDYNGKAAGSMGACFLRGDGYLSGINMGLIQSSAMADHNHGIVPSSANADAGPNYGNTGLNLDGNKGDMTRTTGNVNPSVSLAAETRPLNVTGTWAIKLFGAVINPGSADAAQLATDMANLQAQMTAQQQQFAYGPGGSATVQAPYALRNYIINGNMYMSQRFGGNGINYAQNDAKYGLDRWVIQTNQLGPAPAPGAQQRGVTFGDLPQAEAGITSYIAMAGLISGANGLMILYQHIENCQSVPPGPAVVSFYARRTVAGSVGIRLRQNFGGAGASPGVEIGCIKVPISTVWKRYTVPVTIPSMVGKTMVAHNSMIVSFDVAVMGNVMPGGYGAIPGWNDGGEFQVTGVQFERGSIATPFEQIPFGLQVELCQRYYERGDCYIRGYGSSVAGECGTIAFRTLKRTGPAMATVSSALTNSSAPSYNAYTPYAALASVLPINAAPQGFSCDFSWTADAEIAP